MHRRLGNNPLVFTAGMFDRFANLTSLLLDDISTSTLPTGIFDSITQLQVLYAATVSVLCRFVCADELCMMVQVAEQHGPDNH